MSFFSLTCIIVGALNFLLAGVIFFALGQKTKVHLLWATYCTGVSIWSTGLGLLTSAPSPQLATIYLKIHYFGAIGLLPVFFHFIHEFLNIPNPRSISLMYLWAFVLQVLSLFGVLTFAQPHPLLRFYTAPRPVYGLFVLFLIPTIFYSHYLLFKHYRQSDTRRRKQIRYFLLGTLSGFFGGLTTLSPVFNWPLFPMGMIFVFAYTFIVFYAITRHRLMDISIIIRKTLIYSTVTVILTLIYLLVITVLTRIFQGLTGYQTVFSSTIAACLITLCFQPLRKKVQAIVDSKFFRQYVDREEKLYELSREVITHTTPEAMAESLMRVLVDTLHPKSAVLYLKSRDGDGFTVASNSRAMGKPDQMPEVNALANYFLDHPQPFIQQEFPTELGEPLDTRRPPRKEDAA